MGLDASLAVPTAHEGLNTIRDQQHSLRRAGLEAHPGGISPCPTSAMGGCWHAESLPQVLTLAPGHGAQISSAATAIPRMPSGGEAEASKGSLLALASPKPLTPSHCGYCLATSDTRECSWHPGSSCAH